jgi:hypothetical protein
MSLGGVEFALFSEPLEADIKARVDGEYFWGRHVNYGKSFAFTGGAFFVLLLLPY